MKLTITFETKMWLLCGIVMMFFLAIFRYKKYGFTISKMIKSSLLLILSGMLGLFIMFYIENRYWGGISFFGTILIGPILLWPLLYLAKINFFDVLSLYTPCIGMMHILMKLNCFRVGCCVGNDWYSDHIPIPLQLLEALCIMGIIVCILYLEKKEKKVLIFPTYLILYGIVRFFLNLYRIDLEIFFYLPAGNVWSIVSIIFGLLLLLFIYIKRLQQ